MRRVGGRELRLEGAIFRNRSCSSGLLQRDIYRPRQ